MDITVTALILCFVAAFLFGFGLLPDGSEQEIRRRIFSEIPLERRPTFMSQLAESLEPIHRYVPLAWYSTHVWEWLESAGLRLHPMHFLVLQEIGALAGLLLYLVTSGGGHLNLSWMLVFVVGGFMIPLLWLRNRIQARRLSISQDLPAVVDLLNLCVGAGGDFATSLSRIVREFRPCALREELGIVLQEIRVGKRRRDALQGFSNRMKLREVQTFTRTLVQVDRMGTGLAESLQVLAEDMRLARYHWAERFAQQAPVKMLLPLLCSLSAALMVVAGPVLIQFLIGGFTAPLAHH